jgi:hypothetical protein
MPTALQRRYHQQHFKPVAVPSPPPLPAAPEVEVQLDQDYTPGDIVAALVVVDGKAATFRAN